MVAVRHDLRVRSRGGAVPTPDPSPRRVERPSRPAAAATAAVAAAAPLKAVPGLASAGPAFSHLGPTGWPAGLAAPELIHSAPGLDFSKLPTARREEFMKGPSGGADEALPLFDSQAERQDLVGLDSTPVRTPQAVQWDPFSLVQQLGFRERPSGLAFQLLRALAWRVPIIHAIIQTRVNQISAFASVQTHPAESGFRIRMRNPEDRPTAADKKFIQEMQQKILSSGVKGPGYTLRDNFDLFLRKIARDSLTLDQACWEIVPDAKGRPAAWYAVDAATIRRADTGKLYQEEDPDAVQFVQVYDSAVVAEFTGSELGFLVRNPRTDIQAFGYGMPEIEMLLQTITHMLWGIDYNAAAFSQGAVVKGLLNIVGTMPPKNLRAFRRHFYQMVSGVGNAFRTPITNAEKLEWINLHVSNRDMEYSAWFDFLIKIACAMFAMNPIEVNFKYGNSAQRSMFEGAQRSMSQESKERGLRPVLRTLGREVDRTIVWPHSDNFVFEFAGLDSMTPKEMADLNTQRVRTMYTVNQMRIRNDEEPLGPEGDVILDGNFLAYMNLLERRKQAEAQAAQQQALTAQPGASADELTAMVQQLQSPKDKSSASAKMTEADTKGVTATATGAPGKPHSTPAQTPTAQQNEILLSMDAPRRRTIKIEV